MKKIIDFCKKEYKILIPIMVIIVLLVTLLFLYKEYKFDNQRNKEEVSVYQMYGGVKNEYTLIVTYNLKKEIVGLESKKININLDATPIYYMESNTMILPEEMTIVFPLKDFSQFKLYAKSVYTLNDEVNIIKTGKQEGEYDHFFLYNPEGIYVFSDSTTIKIDGSDYKELSSFSYVSYVGGNTFIYYDKESDTSDFLEVSGKEIEIYNKYFNLSLSNKRATGMGKTVIMYNPDGLNLVF